MAALSRLATTGFCQLFLAILVLGCSAQPSRMPTVLQEVDAAAKKFKEKDANLAKLQHFLRTALESWLSSKTPGSMGDSETARLQKDLNEMDPRLAGLVGLVRRVLDSKSSASGPDSAERAQLLVDLAQGFADIGYFAIAEFLMKRALPIQQKVFGENHPEYALTLSWLALLSFNRHDARAGRSFLVRGVHVIDGCSERNDPTTVLAIARTARGHKVLGEVSAAERLLNDSIARWEKCPDTHDSRKGKALTSIARAYYKMGRNAKCEEFSRQAVAILERSEAETDRELMDALHTLGTLLISCHEYQEARPVFLRAIKLAKKVFGNDHPQLGLILLSYGNLCLRMKRAEEAERVLSQALAIFESFPTPEDTETGHALEGLGAALFDLERYEEARKRLVRAFAARLVRQGEDNPHTKRSLRNLITFCKGMYLDEQAHLLIERYGRGGPSKDDGTPRIGNASGPVSLPRMPHRRRFHWGKSAESCCADSHSSAAAPDQSVHAR